MYDGHVRQGQNDGPNTVTAGGFRVSGAPARLGVTAYEGDSGNVGAVLRVNGTAVADPSTGSTTNFFNSSADNELDPAYANNFSVDSKLLDVPAGLIPAGATSAEIETRTTGDTYVLQSVVLSVPVPALCLEKSVSPATAVPGDTLTWTLQVSNPTTSDALDVAVSDPEVPACDRPVGTLAAGASTTYTCTSTATADLTNVATATGTASGGNALSASATASVDVVAPEVAVTNTVEPQHRPARGRRGPHDRGGQHG